MAKGRREIPPCCKTYGLPLYCASCVPVDRIESSSSSDENEPLPDQDEQQDQDQDREQEAPKTSPPPSNSERLLVAVGGGGGEGRSGVPNALILSAFDFASRSLSDHPVCRLGTDKEVPYRMAMHPGGEGFVCSFPKSCRWFEWDFPENKEPLTLKSSEKILTKLQDVGLQLALAFSAEGSVLAAGGEDGHLRVFKWPSMEIILDQTDAHSTVKDLDFSFDAKYLVSSGSSGPCRVWDLTSSVAVASLQREDGEMFGFCRFSQSTGENQRLYVTAMHGDYVRIISWDITSWKRSGSKRIGRDPVSAFNVSLDGKFLAMYADKEHMGHIFRYIVEDDQLNPLPLGTVEGNVVIINSSNMQPLTTVKKAHLGIVTALVFSQGSRALVSTSFDSTARVTLIEGQKKNGVSMWFIVLVLLLSLVCYFMTNRRTF